MQNLQNHLHELHNKLLRSLCSVQYLPPKKEIIRFGTVHMCLLVYRHLFLKSVLRNSPPECLLLTVEAVNSYYIEISYFNPGTNAPRHNIGQLLLQL